MRGRPGLSTSKLALVGMLAVVAFLIFISLGERDTSSTPKSALATAGGVAPAGENAGQTGSAVISNSQPNAAGQSGQVGGLKPGEGVNPTIDRYGVPVSVSLPVVPGAQRDAQSSAAGSGSPQSGVVDRRNMQAPEAGVAQNRGDPSQGPGASNTEYAGLPPEGSNPQMSGQAPEAFDPGLPMLPPSLVLKTGLSGVPSIFMKPRS